MGFSPFAEVAIVLSWKRPSSAARQDTFDGYLEFVLSLLQNRIREFEDGEIEVMSSQSYLFFDQSHTCILLSLEYYWSVVLV